jgi:hypothetical protein
MQERGNFASDSSSGMFISMQMWADNSGGIGEVILFGVEFSES